MARVRIISPTGQSGSIEDTELEGALAQGFRLPTAEEHQAFALQQKYGDQELRAGAEGAARGFSLGLSDPFLEGLGVPTEALAGRKDANPNAALAGEVAGTVASVATPGGPASLVAKVGLGAERLVAKGAAGLGRKLIGKAVGGALEGATFGAGQAVSESTLRGTPLEADMIMAHVGLGSILGAGGNALAGAAGVGLKATAKAAVGAVGDGGAKELLQKFSRERALKVVFIQNDLQKVALERQAQIADDILPLLKPGMNAEEALAAMKAAKLTKGAELGQILKDVDQLVGGSGPDIRAAVAQRRAVEAARLEADADGRNLLKVALRDDLEQDLQKLVDAKERVREQLAASLTRMSKGGGKSSSKFAYELRPVLGLPEAKQAKALDELAGRLVQNADARVKVPELKYSELRGLVSAGSKQRNAAFEDLLGRLTAGRAAAERAAPESLVAGVGFDMLSAVDRIRKPLLEEFNDPAFEAQKRQLLKLLDGYAKKGQRGVSFAEANKFKSNLQRTISKFTDAPVAQEAKVRLQTLLDDEIESQIARAAGDDVLKKYVDAKRIYGSLAEATKAGKKAVNRQLGNRAVSLTDYLAGIGGAAAGIASGNPLPLILGGAGALANKILRERGSSTFAVIADRLAKQNTIDGALGAVLKRMETGTSEALAIIGRTAKGIGTPAGINVILDSPLRSSSIAGDDRGRDRNRSISAHVDELAELAASPALLTDRLSRATSRLSDLDPALGPVLAAKATKAVEFLNAVAPKPAVGTMLKAFDGGAKWQPSDTEASRFERHLNAVADPLSIYEDLAAGTVTREAVEALQAVYPELYTDMQRRLLEQLGGLQKQLPYNKRLALAELFDVPVDSALQPDMLMMLQATFMQKQGGSPGAPPPMRPPNIAQDSASRMDRLAAR